MDQQIEKIKEVYRRKMNIMLTGMNEFMPKGLHWTKPEGGMFLWVTLPEGMDSGELLKKALKKRVAFVSGRAFFADPKDGLSTLRLNFTHPSDQMITEGLRRLGAVINQELVSTWDKSKGDNESKMEDALKGTLIGKS
jgi:DNA-binding transcriptional MocR family regulator